MKMYGAYHMYYNYLYTLIFVIFPVCYVYTILYLVYCKTVLFIFRFIRF